VTIHFTSVTAGDTQLHLGLILKANRMLSESDNILMLRIMNMKFTE